MTVDTSQNVGIGTTSPAWNLHVSSATTPVFMLQSTASATNASAYSILKANSGAGGNYYRAILGYDSSNVTDWAIGNYGTAKNNIGFYIGPSFATAAATIDSSGNLLVGGTSSTARLAVSGPASASYPSGVAFIVSNTGGDTAYPAAKFQKVDASQTTSQVFLQFVSNSGSNGCGQINANGVASAAFGTYSDQRLKENITSLPSQLGSICALRPVEFDYIESEGGGHQIGFIAQEVALAQDAAGIPFGQLANTSNPDEYTVLLTQFVPPIVKAIQELSDEVDALKIRVTDLETENAAQQVEIDNLQIDVSNLSSGKVSNPAEAPVAGQVLGWNGTATQWVIN
jgi:hypothetical protein